MTPMFDPYNDTQVEPFLKKSHCRHCGRVIYQRETTPWYHEYGSTTMCSTERLIYAEPTDNVRTI